MLFMDECDNETNNSSSNELTAYKNNYNECKFLTQ